jgi:hypothetical protein
MELQRNSCRLVRSNSSSPSVDGQIPAPKQRIALCQVNFYLATEGLCLGFKNATADQ